MAGLEAKSVLDKSEARGINQEVIKNLHFSGIDINSWLKGFANVEDSVQHSVEMVRHHPLFPADIPVHGLVIDPGTGKLDVLTNGYENVKI